MDPMRIDMTEGRVAGFASSHMDGRERWTQLEVRHIPTLGRCWVAEIRHTGAGEPDKVRRMASSSLERALRLFDDSDLATIARESALEFAEEHGLRTIFPGLAANNDRDALGLLFGVPAEDVNVRAAARAFDMGESSIRMAIRDGRDIRVPLRTLLPFIDRTSFRRARRSSDRG